MVSPRRLPRFILIAISLLPATHATSRPVVALLTDFGLENEAVGLCHGAILAVSSDIEVVDLCHAGTPFDVRLAGLMLRGTEVFPKGTVFVAVVDPGVGTERSGLAIKTGKGFFYVAPNNGLLSSVMEDQGVAAAYILEPTRVNPSWTPGTFDGRDLFSPAGALLATGHGGLERVGRPMPLERIVRVEPLRAKVIPAEKKVIGHYVRTDLPYGNVWTDITRENLQAIGAKSVKTLLVRMVDREVPLPLVVSFGHVAKGQPLAYFASDGCLALALNQGNLKEAWGLEEGMDVEVRMGESEPR